ncbi:MAG: hypothetical protein QOG23_3987 [Blastocatellia bacterium]|jgi:hypothetical protein|nr:hypothetical protein [Blastocatellia bacterium]
MMCSELIEENWRRTAVLPPMDDLGERCPCSRAGF